MPEELYQQWQIEILKECYRVLKEDGSMWYNHKNRIKNGKQIKISFYFILQIHFSFNNTFSEEFFIFKRI